MSADKNNREHEQAWLLKEKYASIETTAYFADLERLMHGEPIAYLIGHTPFLDTTIFLDSRPLIPRPETEYWVAQAITEMHACGAEIREKPLSVLDLCAGSGCIGAAVLKAVPYARVDFAEIDTCHHETIGKNLRVNTIDPARAHIYGGDLFAELEKEKPQYDFILANPPYIDPTKVNRVETDVIEYEPHEALFGGIGGMEYICRIIRETHQYLAPGGLLYIEHEPEQTLGILTLAKSLPYASCNTYPDQYQRDRYTRLVRLR